MGFKSILLVCLIFCCQISRVTAASECTGAILASVFGTIGTLLVIAAIAALVWYCCRKKSGTLSSGSSVETGSEPEISLGAKTKGGDIGLNGHGTPVTFSHHYSEEAPSAAYNTKGVVNPAFGGSREVLIDMPPRHDGEVKIDMDGSPSIKPLSHKGDVKINMGGDADVKLPGRKGDAQLDMDFDHGPLDLSLSDGSPPDASLPEGKLSGLDLPDSKLSGSGFSGGHLPGADADVHIEGPSKPTFNLVGPKNMQTVDVELDRPEQGGLGLLIAKEKSLPTPALFVREVTPGGIAAKTGVIDAGDKIIGINGVPIEGMPHDRAMSLLRDDKKPKLQLKLLKNTLYKDESLDLPGGSLENSCKIDVEPTLEAGVPSVDIEGMQGDTPALGEVDISARKPGFDMSGPQVDTPERNLKTKVSGPNFSSDVDVNSPSAGVNLPTTETKTGKCFSCASSAGKDEPYMKRKSTVDVELDRPKHGGMGLMIARDKALPPPALFVTDVTPGGIAAKTGLIDKGDKIIGINGVPIEGMSHDNAMSLLRNEDKPNLRLKLLKNGRSTDLPGGSLEAGAPSSELNMPNKKKRGNCFSCAGNADKEEPYKRRKGNADFDFNGPRVGESIEMKAGGEFDLSRNDTDLEGHFGRGNAGFDFNGPEVEVDANAPDINAPGGKMKTEISGPGVSLPAGEMKRAGKFDIRGSGTDFEGGGIDKEIGLRGSGPDFGLHGRNKGAVGSLDIPGGSLEKSCRIDIEPTLEAGVPSADIEGMQGDAHDLGEVDVSARKPGLDMSGPQVDRPEGKLKTQLSGPSVSSDVDLKGPSADLNLPSAKTKRGKCFSCASSGGKDEPYVKRKPTVDVELDRPRHGDLGLVILRDKTLPPPALFVTDVTPGGIAAKTGVIDKGDKIIGINGVPIEGMSHENAMGLLRNEDKPKLQLKLLKNARYKGKAQSPHLPGGSVDESFDLDEEPTLEAGAPSAELNMSTKKKMRGNCFSCAGDADKEEPYKGRKGNADFEMKSGGKFNPSGTDINLGGDVGRRNAGYDFSAPEVGRDAPEPSMTVKGRGPQEDLKLSASPPDVGGDVALPRSSTALPSAREGGKIPGGNIDISADRPGLNTDTDRPGVEIDANDPEFKTKGNLQTEMSGPDVDVSRENFRGPKANIHGPSADLNLPSKKKPRGKCFSCAGDADRDEPYQRGKGNAQFDFDGPDFDGSLEMTKPAIGKPNANIGGKASGPDFDLDSPDVDVSAKKPKIGLKSSELDASKAGGSGEIDIRGPDLSYGKPKISGPSLGKSDKDIDIRGPDVDINAPDVDASANKPDTGFSSPEFDVSKPGGSVKMGRVGLDANAPDLEKDKGKLQAGISGPDVNGPSGNVRGPKANIHDPSAELNLPSKKKPRGKCFSCAGDVDKDEPYRRGKGNAQFDFDGPDFDGSLEMTKPAIGKPNANIGGKASGPDFDLDSPDVDVSAKKPKIGLKSSELDASKAGGSGEIDIRGPDLSYGKPKISGPSLGKSDKDIDIRGPDVDINAPDFDASANTPVIGFSSPEFDVSKPGGSVKIGSAGLDANASDLEKDKGKLQAGISRPDVDVPSGNFKSPKANINGPSADLDLPSKKKPRSNCLSCAGSTDKDEPYIKATGKPKFDLDAPDVDGSLNADIGGRVTGPEFDMSTPDVDISSKKPKIGVNAPDMDTPNVGSSEININGPDFEAATKQPNTGLNVPNADIGGKFSGPELEMDTPDIEMSSKKPNIGLKAPDVDTPNVGGSGERDINGPDFDAATKQPNTGFDLPNAGGKLSGPEFEIDTPLRAPDVDTPNVGGSGEIEINGPEFSFDKPKVSGPSIGKTAKGIDIGKPDFDVNTPDVDPATKRSNFGFDFLGFEVPKPKDTGEIDLNGPDFSYEKPKISGPSVGHSDEDINIRGPDLDTDTPQGPEDLEISVPSLDGGISWPSTSGGELDVEANLPDMDISKNKPRFGIDTNLPDTNGLEGDQTGNVDLNLNRPDLDATSNPRFGMGIKELERSGTDVTFPSIDKNEPSGSEFNAKFDWDINTSTPKVPEFNKQLKGFSPGDVELETSPVEGDISVVNTYDNFELQSTPQSFPSETYDEPRSLQRYDEIRPEMELRLLSPKDSGQSQPKFNFEIPDASPGSMTLVKVEENVTVCSASVDEEKPSSPTYRTLTLDREVKQKIEIVFPAEEDSNQPSKLKRSTSSSSSSTSSSSDAEGDKEKKPKGKKKSRQFRAFRKSSSSSASSKNGDTPAKRKEKDRKVSSSSSSSDDERIEKKKRPSKSDALPVKTIEEEIIRIGSSSSSSDEAPSVGQQKDLTKRKSSTSSSSSSDKEGHEDGKLKLEHEKHPFVIAERKQPEEPVPSSNTIQGDVPLVSHSVEPVDPDMYFVVEKPDEEIKLKDRRSSTSSSSDEESKPPVAYKVEYNTHPQQYLIEPEKKPNPIFISSADVQEDAPEVVLYSVKPVDPDFSFTSETQTKQKERRSSTSSSSSSGDEALIDAKEAKATDYHGPQTVEFTLLPQKNIGSYDIKPLDEQATPERKSSTSSSSSDEEKEVPKRKSSTSSSSDDKEAKATNFHGPQTVEFTLLPQTKIGSYDIKLLDEQAAPERKNSTSSSSLDQEKEVPKRKISSSSSSSEGKKVSERKISTSSSSSEEGVDLSPTLGVTVPRYETVHHVITPDYPSTEQETESLEMQEKPFVVVSRSIKRPNSLTTAADEQDEPHVLLSSTEVQMSRPTMDVYYHFEYPSNHAEVEEDKDAHVQEEGIVPIFKSPSEDHDVLKVSSALLELPDEEKGAEPDIRTSPTWDIQTHTFQTVYHVTIPDNPARDEDSQEIQEFSPTVVYRSVKKTTPLITSGDDDLEEEPQFFISSTEVQFSEPSYDFQLEYPENDKVSSTEVQDVPLTDGELIKRHTFKKETPDISALLASFDHPEDESQQSGDSLIKTEDEEKSPQEISPKDIKRRGSNSRLWDLMQGYLIEQPILDGGEPNIESKPENNVAVTREEEPKVEIAKPVPKVESSVFELNQQTTETVFEVTQPSKLVTYQIHLDDKEPSKEVITSTTKVESSIAEVTPKASKFDPIYFQVDVGAKKPVSKESTSSWRKEDSGLVDVDDKEDPWMRHYSKGLQHGSSYHGSPSTKSPEIETSFAQSRSLSLSKVPHVKGIRTSAEKERGKPRYSIEGRTSAEPPAYRGTTERRPLLRELEAVPRVRPTETVFSIKDDKDQPQKSQASSTREESSRERSDSGPSVRSLRALWDK